MPASDIINIFNARSGNLLRIETTSLKKIAVVQDKCLCLYIPTRKENIKHIIDIGESDICSLKTIPANILRKGNLTLREIL